MLHTAAQFHSQIASDFDALYSTSPAFRERYNVWTSLLDKYIVPGAHVLDLGCGSGVFSFYLAQKSCKVIGLDGAENMIQLCNDRRAILGLDQVQFICAEIPLAADILPEVYFDAIISSSVLEYIDDLEAVLSDMDARLKTGGVLIISFPNKNSVYRWIEKWSYQLLGKPAYYRYVRHVITSETLEQKLHTFGYKHEFTQYYAATGAIMRVFRTILPVKYATNLFVSIYRK